MSLSLLLEIVFRAPISWLALGTLLGAVSSTLAHTTRSMDSNCYEAEARVCWQAEAEAEMVRPKIGSEGRKMGLSEGENGDLMSPSQFVSTCVVCWLVLACSSSDILARVPRYSRSSRVNLC